MFPSPETFPPDRRMLAPKYRMHLFRKLSELTYTRVDRSTRGSLEQQSDYRAPPYDDVCASRRSGGREGRKVGGRVQREGGGRGVDGKLNDSSTCRRNLED